MIKCLLVQGPVCIIRGGRAASTLTAKKWGILKKTFATLDSASDVIPNVCVLKHILTQETMAGDGIKTMKVILLEAMNRCIKDMRLHLMLATRQSSAVQVCRC